MRLLLDSCTFLWMVSEPASLSRPARDAIVEPENQVFLSAVSVAEIAAKYRRGRLGLHSPPERLIPCARERHSVTPLPLDEEAALYLSRLPDLHRDPFDRLLIAQALAGGLVLVTPDEAIRAYPVRTLW